MSDRKISINVPVLARVEGEGALELDVNNSQITKVKLNIFEPPRFFEKFLEGRHFSEVPDIVARICGICPVAYQMSAVHAFESLFSCDPGPWVRELRRLFYCGEWIESHSLHIHLLAAPDFLGYESAPAMAKDHAEEVRRGLTLQALGNDILRFLGGRSVHPVGARVGGFHHSPTKRDAHILLEKIRQTLPMAEAMLSWTASLALPASSQDFSSVALRHPDEYPMNSGSIISSAGLNLPIKDFELNFQEFHASHSTALHCLLDGKPYLVGPLARLNLNQDKLPDFLAKAVSSTGLSLPSSNMFHSVIARAIEVLYAMYEAIRILETYEPTDRPYVEVQPKAGLAFGCTEAPRGFLWHRYEVDDKGILVNARIVPPTSQNQARMEEDLRMALTDFGLDQEENKIRKHAETVVRNYDPCISCATHFLDLRIRRS